MLITVCDRCGNKATTRYVFPSLSPHKTDNDYRYEGIPVEQFDFCQNCEARLKNILNIFWAD